MTTEEPQEPSIQEPQAPPALVEPPPAINPRFTGPKALTDALSRLDMSDLHDDAMKVVQSGQVSKRPRAIHVLNTLEGLKRNQMTPKDLVMNSVPVIPPIFRPFSVMGTTFVPGDANELYRDLMLLRDSHKEAHEELGDEGTHDSQLALYDAVKAVYGYGEPVDPKTRQRGVSGFLKTLTSTNPKFCYDAHTEILTEEHGWIPFPHLAVGDKVAMYSPGDKCVVWEEPTEYYRGHYEGPMVKVQYAYDSGAVFEELLVTPDHRMWELGTKDIFKTPRAKEWVGLPQSRLITVVGESHNGIDATVSVKATVFEGFHADIYCCTVPSGWLVVRRIGEGGIVSGNSTVQRKLISKTQDTVGRGVITPNPDLKLDEIGVPHNMAWTMYAPYIQRRLVQHGMSRTDALKEVVDRTDIAHKALERELKERPVIYSRSPSWHKLNILAGHPRLVEGDAITINPLVSTGMNADYDGDQCINQIYACISNATVQMLRMSYHNIDSHQVRFPQGAAIPSLEGSSTFLFDLEDFPHGELLNSKVGKNGTIDFHSVMAGVLVLSYDEETSTLKWAPVACWSKHYSREIEIVTTHNEFQIVTDDDPRAVYGTQAGALNMQRFNPADALTMRVLIPRAKTVPTPTVTTTCIPGVNDSSDPRAVSMRASVKLDANVGWVLGAMCGDGWVIKAYDSLRGFALADNEGFNITAFKNRLMHIFERTIHEPYAVHSDVSEEGRLGSTTSYRFSSVNAGAWFRALIGGERDETTSGSANKHLPPFYLSAPVAFRNGLLAGLLDTDGSISVSRGKKKPQLLANLSSTSIRMVQETKLLAASLGISSRITPSKTPLGKSCWMLSFSNKDIQKWNGANMVHEGKLLKLRALPIIEDSSATARYDIIPIPEALARQCKKIIGCPKIKKESRVNPTSIILEKMVTQSLYISLAQSSDTTNPKYGAISRQQALSIVQRVTDEKVRALEGGTEWLRVVHNTDVTWERVTEVIKTDIREDGYDLTVPGYETFMSADGIILSNTMNVHVPSMPESVKEAYEKLMPSKMLLSDRDREKVTNTIKHEQVLGLFQAIRRPATKVHQFRTEAEATAAVKSGKINMWDEVQILGAT